ncbi:MAG: hypothetical protein LBL98_04510 [Ruminococcus sp.]|jgi:hypothetical protein|nr:hypothetical protein [Ruminococcus sp.]
MKKRRLSGTVLILVVAFMLILIVFCMATLAMVSTANKRAITKFEENQSYYTAASALEIFALGTLKDSTYYATTAPNNTTARPYINDTGSSVDKLTQGRALELDLYKLAVLKDTSATDQDPLKGSGKKGTTGTGANFFPTGYSDLNYIINAEDPKFFADPSAPVAVQNYAKQFIVQDTSSPFKYAEYTMALPGISSSGNTDATGFSHGLFADAKTGTADGEAGTIYPVNITVEVIERYYNMQGIETTALKKYLDVIASGGTPTADEAAAVSAIFDPATYIPGNSLTYVPKASLIEEAIRGGKRNKDYFRIRVTAEATLLGVKGTTAREFVVSMPMPEGNNMAVTNFGYSDNGASMGSIGGLSSLVSTKVAYPENAGQLFSGGAIHAQAATSGKLLAEDTVKAEKATPFITTLDTIVFRKTPSMVMQGYNTVLYTVNGVDLVEGGVFPNNDDDHALHFITGGSVRTTNGYTIKGNLVADSVSIHSNGITLEKAGSHYGDVYLNNLHVKKQKSEVSGNVGDDNSIYLDVEGKIYANNIILGSGGDTIQSVIGGITLSSDGVPLANASIQINDTVVEYSGGVYLASEAADLSTATKYIIEPATWTNVGVYMALLNGASEYDGFDHILRTSTGTVIAALNFGSTAAPSYMPSNPKIAVNYYGDTDGDGTPDYTMSDKYQKEFKLPYKFYPKTGAALTDILTVDTARSIYGTYFDSTAVWGTGMGVDADGDGMVDNGANGGDGALIGLDTDTPLDGVANKYIYYGMLDNSFKPAGATYNRDLNLYDIYKHFGYARYGDGTYLGVLDLVITAPQQLKKANPDMSDLTEDGTTLDLFSTDATVDNTPGSLMRIINYFGGGSVTGTINYAGTITSSGKIPDTCFLRADLGSNVYLVDTDAGGDITLQMPLQNASDVRSNIVLIANGNGKLNVVFPELASETGSPTGNAIQLGGNNNNPFIVTSVDSYCLMGIVTSGGKFSSYAHNTNVKYTAGSNVTTPTDSGKVTVYVGKNNSVMQFQKYSFINGVVYAPESTIKMPGQSDHAPQADAYFNPTEGATPTVDQKVELYTPIVGNMVCAGYDAQSGGGSSTPSGVMYLPSDTAPPDGLPNLSWNSSRYLSGQQ